MPRALAGVAVCAIAFATTVVVQAQGDVRVTTLPREDHVLVSLELTGAYTQEIRDAVASGLEATFSFDVELRQPVVSPLS